MIVLARLAFAGLLCLGLVECGGGGGGGGGNDGQRRCPSSSDTLSVDRRVVRANQECLDHSGEVTGTINIVNGSIVTLPVTDAAGGLAHVKFPLVGTCHIYQVTDGKSARLKNRPSQGELFWQFQGKTVCTTYGNGTKTICGTADVFVSILQSSHVAQWGCSSDPDPELVVAVRRGVLRVTPPGGGEPVTVQAGQAYDALNSTFGPAMFSDLDDRLFGEQGGRAKVDVTTSGPGSVVGPEISCGSDCSQVYTLGSVVTLMAQPASGAEFVSWSGDCQASATTCRVVVNGPKAIGATFQQASPTTTVGNLLTVDPSGPGTVLSGDGGIACGADCQERYAGGTITLVPTAEPGAIFVRWTGDCAGIETSCQVSMSAAHTVGAQFATCTIASDAFSVLGTEGDDVICAGSSTTAREINGLGGNDIIEAGSGNDTLYGGEGDDFVVGSSGDDNIDGGLGFDTVYGGDGSDTCDGAESSSSCEAAGGIDGPGPFVL